MPNEFNNAIPSGLGEEYVYSTNPPRLTLVYLDDVEVFKSEAENCMSLGKAEVDRLENAGHKNVRLFNLQEVAGW